MTVLTIVALLFSGLVLSRVFEDFYLDMRKNDMINEGQQLIALIVRGVNPMELLDISKFINAHAFVIDRQGLIKASSSIVQFKGMSVDGKELSEVLKGQIVVYKGHVKEFNASMLMVALPIKTELGVVGALLLYSPMASIESSVWHIRKLILIAAAGAVLVSTALSFILSRTISRPLVQMKKVAEDMAQGNFEGKLNLKLDDEIGTLAKTMNYLSDALDSTINALAQEKDQLQNVLSSMTDGVITFNSQGEVLMANPQATALLPMNEDNEESPCCEALATLLKLAIKNKKPLCKEVKIDGKFISVRMAPLINKGNDLWGVVAVLQDITGERKQEHLRKEFVGDVSHELRTPLTYLQGYTEALLDGMVKNQDEQDKYLNIILEETLRLRRLVDELLELSQIESGHIVLNKHQFSINNVVKRVIEKLKANAEVKNIDLVLNAENNNIVFADEDRIEQILINLVDNAIRYSKECGQVEIEVRQKDEGIVVGVKDNGPGIPEDELPFIWERFYKIDKARTRQKRGTGLGLAIVKKITEVHGGKVWAKNSTKGGAEFYFGLPIE